MAPAGPIACGPKSGSLVVQVHRQAQRVGELAREVAREVHGLVHRDASERHERDHVGGAHPRMAPRVLLHVDQLDGLRGAGEGAPANGIRGTEDRGIEPVVVRIGLPVDEVGARDLQGGTDGVDHVCAPALAEVGDDGHERLLLFSFRHPSSLPRNDIDRRPFGTNVPPFLRNASA